MIKKLRFYGKSWSADLTDRFRFLIEARASFFDRRIYTLWTHSGHPADPSTGNANIGKATPLLLRCVKKQREDLSGTSI
mgnify:CR=1 FL=1